MSLVATSNKNAGALVASEKKETQLVRTSSLPSPIMKLSGHSGEVLSADFSPSGKLLASASLDSAILIWDVSTMENTIALKAHKNAVLEARFTHDSTQIITCGADERSFLLDVESGAIVRRLAGHRNSPLYACAAAPSAASGVQGATVGNDGLCLWDFRSRSPVARVAFAYPQLSCTFVDNGAAGGVGDGGALVAVAGIDAAVRTLEAKANDEEGWTAALDEALTFTNAHAGSITGLSRAGPGRLLSVGNDATLRVWDVSPFCASGERAVASAQGHAAPKESAAVLTRCAASPCGRRIACGSADRMVYVYGFDRSDDVESAKILYKLPGHTGIVNDVQFHPHEPIIVSASSDSNLFVGELQPYDS